MDKRYISLCLYEINSFMILTSTLILTTSAKLIPTHFCKFKFQSLLSKNVRTAEQAKRIL